MPCRSVCLGVLSTHSDSPGESLVSAFRATRFRAHPSATPPPQRPATAIRRHAPSPTRRVADGACLREVGGEGGIRTLGAVSDTRAFQARTFGRSDTSPLFSVNRESTPWGKWRRGRDLNPRCTCAHAGFRNRCLQPLSHLSTFPLPRASRIGHTRRSHSRFLRKNSWSSVRASSARTPSVIIAR